MGIFIGLISLPQKCQCEYGQKRPGFFYVYLHPLHRLYLQVVCHRRFLTEIFHFYMKSLPLEASLNHHMKWGLLHQAAKFAITKVTKMNPSYFGLISNNLKP